MNAILPRDRLPRDPVLPRCDRPPTAQLLGAWLCPKPIATLLSWPRDVLSIGLSVGAIGVATAIVWSPGSSPAMASDRCGLIPVTPASQTSALPSASAIAPSEETTVGEDVASAVEPPVEIAVDGPAGQTRDSTPADLAPDPALDSTANPVNNSAAAVDGGEAQGNSDAATTQAADTSFGLEAFARLVPPVTRIGDAFINTTPPPEGGDEAVAIVIGHLPDHHYVVIVPGQRDTTIDQVRTYVPDAFASRSRLGAYTHVGAFETRRGAEELAKQLRRCDVGARVVYFRNGRPR